MRVAVWIESAEQKSSGTISGGKDCSLLFCVFSLRPYSHSSPPDPQFAMTLANSSITGRSIHVLNCRCDHRYSRQEQLRAMTDRISFVGWTKCTSGTLDIIPSNTITPLLLPYALFPPQYFDCCVTSFRAIAPPPPFSRCVNLGHPIVFSPS